MLRRTVLALTLLLSFAIPASATWSIVVVNRRTGEVAIGAATCIAYTNLMNGLPAIVIGKGGAVMQARSGGEANLVVISDGLEQDVTPQELLDLVKELDMRYRSRQIGIVGMTGSPVTFTGSQAGKAKLGVAGEVGDLAYAIQGNVLAGAAVVYEAEAALLETEGDTAAKLMAAMVAARDFGGDGRCSCSLGKPQGCGSPPEEFEKSAHTGFMVVARIGDGEAPCETGFDCAQAPYYMRLNIRGGAAAHNAPDPVDQLEERYAEWLAERAGVPDGILSTVESVESMPADGVTTRTVVVRLVDLFGEPLTTGGAAVEVTTEGGAPALAAIGPVIDRGDGSYAFTLTAGTVPGTDRLVITADDGSYEATLFPFLEVRQDAVTPLHAGVSRLSAATGGTVPFVLNAPARARGPYLLLASLSGTRPGFRRGRIYLPLNPDGLFATTLSLAGDESLLPGTVGRLDATGRAEAAFVAPPGMLRTAVGGRVDWAALLLGKGPPGYAGPVGFDVAP